jgi:hypothetical protein
LVSLVWLLGFGFWGLIFGLGFFACHFSGRSRLMARAALRRVWEHFGHSFRSGRSFWERRKAFARQPVVSPAFFVSLSGWL